MKRSLLSTTVLLAGAAAGSAQAPRTSGWPQWGGPNRDFKAASPALATSWPSSGPREVWSRPLGDGYSAIAESGGTLYTMYRPAKGETVVALDAASGRTLWEHTYDAPEVSGMNMEYGPGPHATPLLADGRVYAVGATGKLHALDQKTGRVVWSRDLYGEMGGKVMFRGYSCSPIAHGDNLILTVGGRGQAVVAFDRRDGRVAWKNHDFNPGPSSPLLIDVDGQEQLVVFHADGIAGVDPRGGPDVLAASAPDAVRPEHQHAGVGRRTTSCSSRRPTRAGAGPCAWPRPAARPRSASCGSPPRCASTSATPSAWATASTDPAATSAPRSSPPLDVRTGDVAWQQRNFARANFVHADGKLILLDEDGTLALTSITPTGLDVNAKATVLTNKAWTVPTLVGTRLYLRDRATIKALELGRS